MSGGVQWQRLWTANRFVLGRVRIHPLFLVLAAAAVGLGLWRALITLFLIIILHELGHAVVAGYCGYRVEEVSLLPFGGVAKLSYGNVGFHPRHEAAIAIAGPAVNLLLAWFALGMYSVGLWSGDFYRIVVELNVWIAVFNLLPGLPLDGGRILRAARSRSRGYLHATREAYQVAIALSIALLGVGALALWVGYPHLGAIILGVFLFVSAWMGRRASTMETVRFLDAKRRQGLHGPVVIRALAVPGTASVRDAVQQFAPDRYHMVYVFDKEGQVTLVEEGELLEAAFAGRWLEPLDQWLQP